MVVRVNHKRLDTGETYSTAQVAEITGYNVRTIQRYAKDDLLHAGGSPGKRVFLGAHVAEFLGLLSDQSQSTALVN